MRMAARAAVNYRGMKTIALQKQTKTDLIRYKKLKGVSLRENNDEIINKRKRRNQKEDPAWGGKQGKAGEMRRMSDLNSFLPWDTGPFHLWEVEFSPSPTESCVSSRTQSNVLPLWSQPLRGQTSPTLCLSVTLSHHIKQPRLFCWERDQRGPQAQDRGEEVTWGMQNSRAFRWLQTQKRPEAGKHRAMIDNNAFTLWDSFHRVTDIQIAIQ